MADSGATRMRRARLHRQGDHSLCGSKCTAERVRALQRAPRPDHITTVVAAVDALAAELKLRPDDPRSVSMAVARRLAELVDAGDAPVMAAVNLVGITRDLATYGDHPADKVDEIRAHYHANLIRGFLNN